jgi:hypothetical protein
MSYDQFNKRCFINIEDTLYLLGGSIDKHICITGNGVLGGGGL